MNVQRIRFLSCLQATPNARRGRDGLRNTGHVEKKLAELEASYPKETRFPRCNPIGGT
jgi:hypothetical protein